MKKLSIAAIILASLALAGEAFIFATRKEESEELHTRAIRADYRVYAPSIPDTLTFAGERVPVNLWYVREGLDRELVSNMYYQSNTLFIIGCCVLILSSLDAERNWACGLVVQHRLHFLISTKLTKKSLGFRDFVCVHNRMF